MPKYSFGAGSSPQLAQDIVEMSLDCACADDQFGGDCLVGEATSRESEYL